MIIMKLVKRVIRVKWVMGIKTEILSIKTQSYIARRNHYVDSPCILMVIIPE